jgi:hypothetical protein
LFRFKDLSQANHKKNVLTILVQALWSARDVLEKRARALLKWSGLVGMG